MYKPGEAEEDKTFTKVATYFEQILRNILESVQMYLSTAFLA